MTLVALGTNSGPIPNADRSQPANLVLTSQQSLLIDAGDGAGEQLAKAGVSLSQIQTILITHLHFDHTGGLFALLSERYQGLPHPRPRLSIYGPQGTKRTVDGLIAAMAPGMEATGWALGSPTENLAVVEVEDGARVVLGDVTVTVAENSHYSALEHDLANGPRPVSLSYRIETARSSICFTGDTGPSVRVEQLCRRSDLLVSEVTFPAEVVEPGVERLNLTEAQRSLLLAHFTREHLAPREVGLLALHAQAVDLVITHNPLSPDALPASRAEIATSFKGRITFASDLERFQLD